jgi:ferredoxin
MSLLNLDIAKCVHTSNKFAICNACIENCPVETIKIETSSISFTPKDCVGCGGCLAICPTDAYTLDDFKPINYVFSFLENDINIVTCNDKNLPCIAGLSVEELLSITLLSQEKICLDIGPCSDCPIAQKNLSIIEQRAEEVNFLLEAMEQDKKLTLDELNFKQEEEIDVLSRRELLSKEGMKTVLTMQQEFENRVESSATDVKEHKVSTSDIIKIKEKNIPDRRSLLLMAMKRAKIPNVFHTIDIADISFISQKDLDKESCTNCQMCYRICPTGALSSDSRGSIINFNPLVCVQCHSCHDVCEPDSLTLRKSFNLSSFFEPKIETLIEFQMKRCDECGNFFASKHGEKICNRCTIEEEEARELWGIK